MSLQVSLRNELLVTLWADERPLPCVSPHMRLEVSGLGKFLQTLLKRADQHFFLLFGSLYLFDLGYIESQ